jgi:hypothetical protein
MEEISTIMPYKMKLGALLFRYYVLYNLVFKEWNDSISWSLHTFNLMYGLRREEFARGWRKLHRSFNSECIVMRMGRSEMLTKFRSEENVRQDTSCEM